MRRINDRLQILKRPSIALSLFSGNWCGNQWNIPGKRIIAYLEYLLTTPKSLGKSCRYRNGLARSPMEAWGDRCGARIANSPAIAPQRSWPNEDRRSERSAERTPWSYLS